MAKIKIAKRTVEALKVAAKDYIAFDTDLPGFGVRVMPSGKRFFLVQYHVTDGLGVLSRMMNLAETWRMRDKHSNPCEAIEPYPERKRERFLSPRELRSLGQALTDAEVSETETKHAISPSGCFL